MLEKSKSEQYNFIKKIIFGEIEFNSEKSFKHKTPVSERLKKNAAVKTKNWNPSEKVLIEVTKNCNPQVLDNLEFKGFVDFNSSDLKRCYELSIRNATSGLITSGLSGPDKELLELRYQNLSLPVPEKKLDELINNASALHKKRFSEQAFAAYYKDFFFRRPCVKDEQFSAHSRFDHQDMGFNTRDRKDQFSSLAFSMCEALGPGPK